MTPTEQRAFCEWLWPEKCYHVWRQIGQNTMMSQCDVCEVVVHDPYGEDANPNLQDPGPEEFMKMMEGALKKFTTFKTYDATVSFYLEEEPKVTCKISGDGINISGIGETPPLALLNALAGCWKGEKK